MNGLDRWSVLHAMPLAGRPSAPPTFLESLVPLLGAPFHPAGVAGTQVVTLPGQVVLSFLLVLAAAWRLRLRREREAALCWPAAWLLAVGVELVLRHTLARPALYRDGEHLTGLDMSWPSGHALRCALAAAALAAAWPRLRVPLAAWVAAAVVLLELAGFHTPTDVAGGLLLAVVAAVAGVEASGLLRRRRAALRRTDAAA